MYCISKLEIKVYLSLSLSKEIVPFSTKQTLTQRSRILSE